jgi:hypothetical protein
MQKIQVSYERLQGLFDTVCGVVYLDSMKEVIDFYFKYSFVEFRIIIWDSWGVKNSPEYYCGENYRAHFRKLGFKIDW